MQGWGSSPSPSMAEGTVIPLGNSWAGCCQKSLLSKGLGPWLWVWVWLAGRPETPWIFCQVGVGWAGWKPTPREPSGRQCLALPAGAEEGDGERQRPEQGDGRLRGIGPGGA